MQPFDPGNRLIAALDVRDRAAAFAMVAAVGDAAGFYKVGLELFMAEGPGLVREFAARGRRVMLDVKLHDIPTTVARAVARAADLGAELLTVHAAGGRAMLRAAVDAAGGASSNAGTGRGLRILAVTVLTSLDSAALAELGVFRGGDELVPAQVLALARLALESGCHGVVCSPEEAARVRALAAEPFLIVTPGVRPAGAEVHDQARVMTPAGARRAGADLIVCGRPIRDAFDPAAAARAIAAELEG
jgi:orotidine-5'-phosphate decarboxylase